MSETALVSPPVIDLAAVKTRQQAAWSTGNYAVVGTTLQIVGESLCEALDLRAGMRVLDVAAGNGNATLAAARRWCDVISTDYVPALLLRGEMRASAEGLPVRFQRADAEKLPYSDGAFDAVLSTFGVMFTPDQEKAAAELARVCRPGGRIGLGELDARELHRATVQDDRQVHSTRAGRQITGTMGDEGKARRALRRHGACDPHDPSRICLSLPVGHALDRGVPHLLRADEPRVCRARCPETDCPQP